MTRVLWIIQLSSICLVLTSGSFAAEEVCPCRPLKECIHPQIISENSQTSVSCESVSFVRCCTTNANNPKNVIGSKGDKRNEEVANNAEANESSLQRLVAFMKERMLALLRGKEASEENTQPENISSSQESSSGVTPVNTNHKNIDMLKSQNYVNNVGVNILENVKNVMAFMDANQISMYQNKEPEHYNAASSSKSRDIRLRIFNDFPLRDEPTGFSLPQYYNSNDQQGTVKDEQLKVEENQFSNPSDSEHNPEVDDETQRIIDELMNFESYKIHSRRPQRPVLFNSEATSKPYTSNYRNLQEIPSSLLARKFNLEKIEHSFNNQEGRVNLLIPEGNSGVKVESSFPPVSGSVPEKVSNLPKQKTSSETLDALDRVFVQAASENTPNLTSNLRTLENNDPLIRTFSYAENIEKIKRHIRSRVLRVNGEHKRTRKNRDNTMTDDNKFVTMKNSEEDDPVSENVDTKNLQNEEEDDENVPTRRQKHRNILLNKNISVTRTVNKHNNNVNNIRAKNVETTTVISVRPFKRPPRVLPVRVVLNDDQKDDDKFESPRQRTIHLINKSNEKRRNRISSLISRNDKLVTSTYSPSENDNEQIKNAENDMKMEIMNEDDITDTIFTGTGTLASTQIPDSESTRKLSEQISKHESKEASSETIHNTLRNRKRG